VAAGVAATLAAVAARTVVIAVSFVLLFLSSSCVHLGPNLLRRFSSTQIEIHIQPFLPPSLPPSLPQFYESFNGLFGRTSTPFAGTIS